MLTWHILFVWDVTSHDITDANEVAEETKIHVFGDVSLVYANIF